MLSTGSLVVGGFGRSWGVRSWSLLRGHDYGPVGLLIALSELGFGLWLLVPTSQATMFYRVLADNAYSPRLRALAHITVAVACLLATLHGPRWMRWPFLASAFLWTTSLAMYALALPNTPALYQWALFVAAALWVAIRSGADA